MDIREKVQQAPASPGIYILKGAREKVVYVGKAKNLRNRLRSHFQNSSAHDNRKAKMIEEVRDLQYIVTGNELEALILEASFIKRTKPKYNIILRDDKNYPYLKLTVNERWPRLEVVRRIDNDGARYFGPYVPAGSMWEMLKFIRRTFPVRMCRYKMDRPFRPCVQYQMGRCLAPCSKSLRTDADQRTYRDTVDDVIAFIQGEKKELLETLRTRMQRLSDEHLYEDAAAVRDRITSLEKAWESQRIIAPELGDTDVIGLYRDKGDASVFIFFIRNGTIIGQKDFFFKKTGDIPDRDIIESFIEQFYSRSLLLPAQIIIPVPAKLPTQQKWLSEKRGAPVAFRQGRQGAESKVLKMANDNALHALNRQKNTRVDSTLLEIKKLLSLERLPQKISAFDISNISGSSAAGACVVFDRGTFIKDEYRKFRIRSVQGIDDFAMMEETVDRYLKSTEDQDEPIPDLLLIDGGRGQLKSALTAMERHQITADVAALAKAKERTPGRASRVRSESERIYRPGRRNPVYLDPQSPATHLLQKIRDEVHRFVIQYHKQMRSKALLTSPLENVRGIGRARRLLLLKHFGSIEAIRKASVDDIASLKGMNSKVAGELKASLLESSVTHE